MEDANEKSADSSPGGSTSFKKQKAKNDYDRGRVSRWRMAGLSRAAAGRRIKNIVVDRLVSETR